LYSGQISTVCCGWVSWETNLPSVVVVDAWCIELSSRSLVIRHMYWRAVERKYCDSTRSLRVLSCISIRLSYANLIGIREMSERANDQLADLIGSEYNGHMQAGIASVTPDSRHIRLFPEDWPLCIFAEGGDQVTGGGRQADGTEPERAPGEFTSFDELRRFSTC